MDSLGMAFMGPQVAHQQMRESEQRMELAEMSKGAASRKQAAEATKLEADNARNAELSNLFRNLKPKPGQAQSAALAEMAILATQAGDSQLAQSFLHKSAQAEVGEARQATMAATAAQRAAIANKRLMENFNQIFGGVKTERELADAKLYAMTQPGLDANDAESIQGMTLDRVADMQARLLTAKERADLALREAAERTKRFEAQSRDAKRKADVTAAQQRIDAKAEKDAADGKAGGKDIGKPNTTDINSARAWLSNQEAFQAIGSTEGQRALAVDLAAKTLKVRAQNRALGADEARAKAWLEILSSGSLEDATILPGLTPNRSRYNPLSPKAAAGAAKGAAPLVTATNPKTGEKLVLRNGKWEKP